MEIVDEIKSEVFEQIISGYMLSALPVSWVLNVNVGMFARREKVLVSLKPLNGETLPANPNQKKNRETNDNMIIAFT